jgi:hypothetical protein
MRMRVILSTLVLLAIVGVFIADGSSMYAAHREAVNFSKEAAGQAAQTFVDSKGNQDVVRASVEDLATSEGVELVNVQYHKGTTRWYEVTVRVQRGSILLRHLPFFQDHLAQESTSVEHF